MASTLETLLVRIEGDTKALRGELTGAVTKSQQAATKMERSFDRIAAAGRRMSTVGRNLTLGLTAPIVAAGGAALASAVKLGNYADRMLDLEQITGLSTDTLQEFENVARAAGVPTEALAGAAEGLTRRLRASGEESKLFTDNIGALGVSTREADGSLRELDDLMPEIIGALGDVESITERNALSMQIFGRRASELAPVLALGSDELERLAQEARDMGQVLDRDALNAANNFRIQWEQLRAELGLAGREVQQALLPAMTGLVTVLRDDVIPAVQAGADRVADFIGWFNDLDDTSKRVFATLGGALVAAGPVLSLLGGMAQALPIVAAGFTGLTAAAAPLLGPAGLLIGGTALLATFAVKLNGSGGVKEAAEDAQAALASGNRDSFSGALDVLIDKVDNDGARSALERLREDLIQTGDVSIEQASRIIAAVAQFSLNDRQFFGLDVRGELEQNLDRIGNAAGENFKAAYEEAISSGNFQEAVNVLRGALDSVSEYGSRRMQEFADRGIVPVIQELQELITSMDSLPTEFVDPGTRTGAASTAGGATGRTVAGVAGGADVGAAGFPIGARPFGMLEPGEGFRARGDGGLSAARSLLGLSALNLPARGDGGLGTLVRIANTEELARGIRAMQGDRAAFPAAQREAGEFIDELSRQLTARANRGDGGLGLVPRVATDTAGRLRDRGDGGLRNLQIVANAEARLAVEADDAARALNAVAQSALFADERFNRDAGALSLDLTRRAERGDGGLNEARAITFEDSLAGPSASDSRGKFVFSGVGEDIAQAGEDFRSQQQAAAKEFAGTVIDAGGSFVSAIDSFKSGNIGGGIAAAGQGIGGLLQGLGGLGGGLSALGPYGALIGAGAGLLGGIVNLFGGGGNDQAEQNSAVNRRNLSTLELNYTNNQSITLGALGDPANLRVLDEWSDRTFQRFEDVIKRSILPRLDAVEERAFA